MYPPIYLIIAAVILVLERLYLFFTMAQDHKRQEAERQALLLKIADQEEEIINLDRKNEELEYQLAVTEVDRDCAWNRLSDLEYLVREEVVEEELSTIAKEDARGSDSSEPALLSDQEQQDLNDLLFEAACAGVRGDALDNLYSEKYPNVVGNGHPSVCLCPSCAPGEYDDEMFQNDQQNS